MDKSELARRLMATFLDELDTHVASFNQDLLALEKKPGEEEFHELLQSSFRAAHSLKGASRAVDVPIIEQACHGLEDLLTMVRDGKLKLKEDIFAVLFKAADGIEEAGMRLREEQDLDDAPLVTLIPQIEAFVDLDSANLEKNEPETNELETVVATQKEVEIEEVAAVTEVVLEAASKEEPALITKESQESIPAEPESEVPAQRRSVPASSVRVDADKLDTLMEQAGELLVARQRIESEVGELEALRDSVSIWRRELRSVQTVVGKRARHVDANSDETTVPTSVITGLLENADRIRQLERDLDKMVTRASSSIQYLGHVGTAIEEDIHRARMVPFAEACQRLERTIRDIASSGGKQVRLELVGSEVQVDRSVLEGVTDPLMHIVRNAVDHGIESPAERIAAGKPGEATVLIEVSLHGATVQVRIHDDGSGIDLEKVAKKASSQGLLVPHDPKELARLIFLPAFSTATKITDVSGRGVGLDVVRAEIERLHGSVDVSFEPGQGTCFTLTLPLTLTTIRAVMVKVSDQTFAIPTSSIDRIVRFKNADHATIAGRSVLLSGDSPIALTGLSTILNLGPQWKLQTDKRMLALILSSSGKQVAFAVDDIGSEVELTVKSLGSRVRRLKHVSGATILPSGDIALVLNVANMIRSAANVGEIVSTAEIQHTVDVATNRLLVVDDSATSRMLLQNILDAAGYDVTVAVDGQHALELVQSQPFDLVVSDVDMPRRNGFEFTEAVRSISSISDLPIVLVTARNTEEDRINGIQAGANAYIVKSGFDQTRLLNVISDLL